MDGYDIQNDGCITQKAVEDTISDKCRTKNFNTRGGSREKLVEKVAIVFVFVFFTNKLCTRLWWNREVIRMFGKPT